MDSGLDLFPYGKARSGQAEFLQDARETLRDGKILLAQAPTGLGKTAVALAAALETALPRKQRVLFTTCRRSQHRIAVETLRLMQSLHPVSVADVIARDAMCTRHPDCDTPKSRLVSVARHLLKRCLHVQELVSLARRFGACPYLTAQAMAREADVVVCDYNYLFSPQRPKVLRSLGVGLEDLIIIVDEAHNLPSRTRESLSAALTAEGIQGLADGVAPGRDGSTLHSLSEGLRAEARVVGGESRVPAKFLEKLLERHVPGHQPDVAVEDLRSTLRRVEPELPPEIRRIVEEGLHLLNNWQRPDVLRLLSSRGGGALVLRALDPLPATRPVFLRTPASLVMSGTLHPGSMYVDILGIPAWRVSVKSYQPDFPQGNRLLLLSGRTSSSYRERPESYDAYAELIHEMCNIIPGNVAAFFPSYQVTREVGRRLQRLAPRKPLLFERRGQTKGMKEEMLRSLASARENGGWLLMAVQGGSLSEGVDYPGGLLSTVIVGGLALNPPDLEVEALRSFYARRFGRRKAYEYAYLFPALNKLVQSAGRCIRGPEDTGAVVVLDHRLLRPFYRSRLPPGFTPTATDDPGGALKTFFGSRGKPFSPVLESPERDSKEGR